jgi:hypothetical protein
VELNPGPWGILHLLLCDFQIIVNNFHSAKTVEHKGMVSRACSFGFTLQVSQSHFSKMVYFSCNLCEVQ